MTLMEQILRFGMAISLIIAVMMYAIRGWSYCLSSKLRERTRGTWAGESRFGIVLDCAGMFSAVLFTIALLLGILYKISQH